MAHKVRFVLAWQTYRVGDVIEPTAMDRDWLIANGYVKDVNEVETPGRPAKFSKKAAEKLTAGAKQLFG